ncbi:MAG: ATP-binding protein [Candidatus Limnocylindria bacterium]
MTKASRGTVTLLFVDIAGSTRMLAELGDAYGAVLRDYRRLMVAAAEAEQGILVDTAGDGLFLSFPSARGALTAAIAAQRSFRDHQWPASVSVEARIGIHTGEPVTDEDMLVGLDVHRAARICAAGHGGQILLSLTTHDLLHGEAPGDTQLRDLGEHRLKDLAHPERVFQASAPDLPSEFPPVRSLDNWPNNLPRQLSTFIGRSDALSEASQRLMSTPLLTLTGPGGVGKTRLALELAARSMDDFPDGAWVIELATLSDGALVAETVAGALRVKDQPAVPILTTLAEHLETERVLLVFDDCEHVLDAVADVIDELLRACPHVRVLATSREALGLSGESLFPVPSMSLPDAPSASVADLEDWEAVRLFVDRARAVQPVFALNDHNAAAVFQICRRLDGIPLAIELAAARVKALPPEQIAARLDDRFRLLTGGSRLALPRHRTLKAAMDWSFDLLTDVERALLTRLAVFAGTFSLDAVEAVCSSDGVDREEVLDLLTRLIDQSLVVVEAGAGEARYRLLDTVQQYAMERLVAADPEGTSRGRHAAHMLEVAERSAPMLFAGPAAGPAFEAFSADHDNLRAALQWTDHAPEASATQLRLAASLWRYWEIGGNLIEGRSWLTRALARTDGEISELRATALTGLGSLAAQQGDVAAAVAAHEEALETQRQLGDPNGIAYAASNLANVCVERGDFVRARALYEESISILRPTTNARGMAFALLNLADVAARQGDADEARRLSDDGTGIFRAEGDLIGVALALGRGATFSLQQGDTADARTRHEEALDIFRRFGDGRGVARSLMFLGDIAAVEGHLDEAESLYGSSIAHRRDLGDRGGQATACDRLARIVARDDPERAARLIGFADGQRELIGASLPPADQAERDQLLSGLERRLDPAALASLRNAGRRLPLEAIISEPAPEADSRAS